LQIPGNRKALKFLKKSYLNESVTKYSCGKAKTKREKIAKRQLFNYTPFFAVSRNRAYESIHLQQISRQLQHQVLGGLFVDQMMLEPNLIHSAIAMHVHAWA
jgi:hypothetical protein